MARRVVYLSGRIDHLLVSEARLRREEAKTILIPAGWDVLDPMRGKEEAVAPGELLDAEAVARMGLAPRALIDRDLDDIRRANIVLYLTADDLSWGSLFEVAYASMVAHTPVVAVGHSDSPWARHFISHFADTVAEACEFIIRYFERGYRLEDADTYAAYAAGLVDADGSVEIHRAAGAKKARFPSPSFRPIISVSNTNQTMLHLLQGRWGGRVEDHGPSPLGSKPVYAWRVDGKAFRQVAHAIRPFLAFKQEQLSLALAVSEEQARRGSRNRTKEEIEFETNAYRRVSELNSDKGVKHSTKEK